MSASQDLQRKPSEPSDAACDAVPSSELLRQQQTPVPEIGGRSDGLDPTRYGDWEKNGRCIDF